MDDLIQNIEDIKNDSVREQLELVQECVYVIDREAIRVKELLTQKQSISVLVAMMCDIQDKLKKTDDGTRNKAKLKRLKDAERCGIARLQGKLAGLETSVKILEKFFENISKNSK